jgi:uncharacterized protein YjbJ (UPF0337 family)
MGDFRSQWSKLQTGFVDEPRRTVEDADKLVAAVMRRLAEGFANERSGVGEAVGPRWQRVHWGPADCPTAVSFLFWQAVETVKTNTPRMLRCSTYCYSTTRRKQMNPSTKDEIKGTVHEVKGKVKETAGKVTNSPNLQAEGNAEKNAGRVEKKVGQIEKVFEK